MLLTRIMTIILTLRKWLVASRLVVVVRIYNGKDVSIPRYSYFLIHVFSYSIFCDTFFCNLAVFSPFFCFFYSNYINYFIFLKIIVCFKVFDDDQNGLLGHEELTKMLIALDKIREENCDDIEYRNLNTKNIRKKEDIANDILKEHDGDKVCRNASDMNKLKLYI